MTLLTLSDLSLAIGGTPILNALSLEVGAREVLGLVGESGSGKSLTALSITQLLPEGSALSGSIAWDGEELIGSGEARMRALRGSEIGMIFQEPMTALNPVMTIGDQVAETVRVHRRASRAEALAIAERTLERVGLPRARFPLDRYPHELSGGQRQRVGIAMAIALRPRLLIADEPTTALDVMTQARILDLVGRLVAEDGMGLLLITHDLAVVAGRADRIAVMRAGEIVESGPAAEVFGAMAHPYTRALFSASAHRPERGPPRAEREALLEVEEVSRDYSLPRRSLFAPRAVLRAVDSVSLAVRRGENVGLVGESGCGKSTLARAIMGLDPVQGGTITLDGDPVTRPEGVRFATRRKMQVVFQDPYGSFNPHHTVSRLVAEPFHLLGREAPQGAERARKVAATLEDVGLSAADAEKYIFEFSGGQRQRIAIARALVVDPDLIVLDEAVSALDVSVRARILDLLAALSERRGVSYLFISHDLHVVRAITDRVLVMRAGKIVEEGETEAVFTRPQNPYTRELIAAAPTVAAALAQREEDRK